MLFKHIANIKVAQMTGFQSLFVWENVVPNVEQCDK